MRPLMVNGVLLVVFGIGALVFQGVTLFTTEGVVDAGLFYVDVQKPHKIILNRIVGFAALAGTAVMVFAGSRSSA